MGSSSIEEYFKGKNIFITGGSGFIGKGLIEKLLRSCPNVGNIYILLRAKKGKALYERVEDILNSPLFSQVKKTNSINLKKLIPINGDTSKIGLGMSEDDRVLLKDNVNIFFHIAASVRFDDFLKHAIYNNLRSAREAALLALEMKNIDTFLHVSTSYCNIDNRKVVEEILYPTQGDWKEAIKVAEALDNETLNTFVGKYIGDFPNTYTYTKQLAEHCINDLLVGRIRTIICRPSVVISTMEEPFQGWTDNFNGPIGLLMAGGSGFLRIVYGDNDVNTDYVGVDNVVKIIITCAWHKAQFGEKNEISIYHITKNDLISFKFKNVIELSQSLYWEIPFERNIWFPRVVATTCWYEYYINVLLFHMLPAFLVDIFLRIAGYSPMLVKIQRKIYIGNMAISHFMLNEWKFINKNILELWKWIPDKERKDFNFISMPTSENLIRDFMSSSGNYCRIHLLKENKEITTQNKTRARRMYYLDVTTKIIFAMLLTWVVFIKINFPARIWTNICNYWINL